MKCFLLIWLSIGMLLFCGCSQTTSKESKDFTEIVGNKPLEKIEIVDGRSGKRQKITDKEKIQAFNQLFDDREYKEIKNHEKTKGYIFKANVYCGNKEFIVTFLDDEITINDTYYSLDKPLLEKDISNLVN